MIIIWIWSATKRNALMVIIIWNPKVHQTNSHWDCFRLSKTKVQYFQLNPVRIRLKIIPFKEDHRRILWKIILHWVIRSMLNKFYIGSAHTDCIWMFSKTVNLKIIVFVNRILISFIYYLHMWMCKCGCSVLCTHEPSFISYNNSIFLFL